MKTIKTVASTVCAVLTPASLIAVPAAPVAVAAEQCAAVEMVLAPGTSETAGWSDKNADDKGFLSQSLAQPVAGHGGNVTRSYVTYPATVGGAWPGIGTAPPPKNVGDTTSYADSVATGVTNTEKQIRDISAACPDTKVFLAGFSQGAEVISNVARKIGAGESVAPDKIAGVALFADPTREGGTPLQPDGASTPGPVPGAKGTTVTRAVSGLDVMEMPTAGGLGSDKTGHKDFGEISDRVVSWCLPGDYVCGMPVESELTSDIVSLLEKVSLGDPVTTLQQVAGILDRAVSVGNISEIADLDFGEGGFTANAAEMKRTPVLDQRVATAAGRTTSTAPSTTGSSAPTSTSPSSTAPTASESSTGQSTTAATTTATTTEPTVTSTSRTTRPAAQAMQAPTSKRTAARDPRPEAGLPALSSDLAVGSSQNMGLDEGTQKVVSAAAGIGGMALGAGITVLRQTLTPENLAQIALAGVTGGPQAAAAVAVAKLTNAGMSLLEPASASGYARQVLQVLKDSGMETPKIVELAVDLSAWTSAVEHNMYGERAMLPDGRSAAAATQDWVKAAAVDVSADAAPTIPEQVARGADALAPTQFDVSQALNALKTLESAGR
ncbi:cutinase family protein [Corynebacterium durum]|uniref:cutinase family protein n=1 Tax=Corynebacterium durum TaxID=61592 RepID=UPI0028E51915|nr:cutinase family protein [Corynebacterium durum]